ncbi:hypothetical protein ZYGR_0AD07050 [Zygosaccharomyces rouxii]|uniref:ZYRO0G22374p n=2 Tax=Zygosaccharomyces rouxii TaxID=4956 RepID=C5E1N1_ZYGRC|nr:uncharacterized protein ZYRO0G22374g [Zygosaccharomyces rouxii]KAH9203007.1 HSP20-like chaperone [Zygosaccharomyces rouxii]GAV51522.1 hypothetical protein ZYGR_0AD07050 [Zygosaccharomyces rouxii]CAR30015.1 ZYRO0G22374p [Zygosaccharomyces rouxii]
MYYHIPPFLMFDVIGAEVNNLHKFLDNAGYQFYQRKHHMTNHDKPNCSTELNRKESSVHISDGQSSVRAKSEKTDLVPPVDLWESDTSYELNVIIPGVKDKESIEVEYHDEKRNRVVISGEIPSSHDGAAGSKIRIQESASGRFKREILFPEKPGVDADNIRAKYLNGILHLNIPKLAAVEPEDQVRKIEVISLD